MCPEQFQVQFSLRLSLIFLNYCLHIVALKYVKDTCVFRHLSNDVLFVTTWKTLILRQELFHELDV
jgi:hypothetical protein